MQDVSEAAEAGLKGTPLRSRRRGRDLLAMGILAGLVLLGLVLTGQAHWAPAMIGAGIIAAGGAFWFFGTYDPDLEQMAAEAEAAAMNDARQSSQKERMFRIALIESLPDIALYIDAPGKVEAANAAARRQFRFIGSDPLLSAVVRRPELLDAVAAARSTGLPQQFEIMERDATDQYFAGVAARLGSGVLVSLHDLSDIRRMELARVDFLANASHELRTPLTALYGFIETMRGPARDDPEARERFLEIMQSQAERMRRLISDLLSLSRIELVEHRPPEGEADLASIALETRDVLVHLAAKRGVEIHLSGTEARVSVKGAREELGQVVQNLIDNAVKYAVPGTAVTVDVLAGLTADQAQAAGGRAWDGAGRMSIVAPPEGRPGGTFAVLRVSDRGPGIERQYLPRLSERFYRVEQGRGLKPGTGLGLAIVKHIVKRHRGGLMVESQPGFGSAFGVILPMAGPE